MIKWKCYEKSLGTKMKKNEKKLWVLKTDLLLLILSDGPKKKSF